VNNWCIEGNVGRDPEMNDKGTMARFSVAVSKPPKNKGDDWPTTWVNVKAIGGAVETCKQVRKGDRVMCAGEYCHDENDGKHYHYMLAFKVGVTKFKADNAAGSENVDQSGGSW